MGESERRDGVEVGKCRGKQEGCRGQEASRDESVDRAGSVEGRRKHRWKEMLRERAIKQDGIRGYILEGTQPSMRDGSRYDKKEVGDVIEEGWSYEARRCPPGYQE